MVTYDDSISYVNAVKIAFNDPAKYKEFMDLFTEYREHRIDIPTVTASLRELMKDHLYLYLAFNIFLIPGTHQIKLPLEAIRELNIPPEPTLHAVTLFLIAVKAKRTAHPFMLPNVWVFRSPKMRFFRKLKARFLKHHIYGSVLEILKTYTERKKSKNEACKEIVALVQGHEDLVNELSYIFD